MELRITKRRTIGIVALSPLQTTNNYIMVKNQCFILDGVVILCYITARILKTYIVEQVIEEKDYV
jgi:hypothetical protein